MVGRAPRHSCVRLALVQMRCAESPQTNLRHALEAIARAADAGAGLVVLPELFRTRYFPQHEDPAAFDLAEPVPGPTSEALAKAAAQHRLVVVGSVFERRATGLYHNTALTFDADGRLAALYRKMHVPHDPLFFEKYYFTPGDRGFLAAATRVARVGALVCWDQWFPEAARLSALAGAQVLVFPTAIGWVDGDGDSLDTPERDAWRTVQRAHAIANGVFVAAVNRVGCEEGIRFWGSSFVADPLGRVLVEAPVEDDTLVIADCDLDLIGSVRRTWPFLRDRRVDAYSELQRRFRD